MGPLIEASALESMEKKSRESDPNKVLGYCVVAIGSVQKDISSNRPFLDCVTQKMDIIQEETFWPHTAGCRIFRYQRRYRMGE